MNKAGSLVCKLVNNFCLKMDLNKFAHKETLSTNPTEKKTVYLGTVGEKEGEAILIINAKVPQMQQLKFESIKEVFQNDIYSRYDTAMVGEYEIQSIFPITQKHKDKYRSKQMRLYEESAEEYSATREALLEKELGHIGWVQNIMDGKAEVERVLFRNENFVVLPDFKFANLEETESLHLLVIFADQKLCSIRDLTGDHVGLLQSAQKQINTVLKEKFKLEEGTCRMYFHYPPTFYRLHIHVSNTRIQAATALADRSHMLPTVIGNLKIAPDYYQRISLLKSIEVKTQNDM